MHRPGGHGGRVLDRAATEWASAFAAIAAFSSGVTHTLICVDSLRFFPLIALRKQKPDRADNLLPESTPRRAEAG